MVQNASQRLFWKPIQKNFLRLKTLLNFKMFPSALHQKNRASYTKQALRAPNRPDRLPTPRPLSFQILPNSHTAQTLQPTSGTAKVGQRKLRRANPSVHAGHTQPASKAGQAGQHVEHGLPAEGRVQFLRSCVPDTFLKNKSVPLGGACARSVPVFLGAPSLLRLDFPSYARDVPPRGCVCPRCARRLGRRGGARRRRGGGNP